MLLKPTRIGLSVLATCAKYTSVRGVVVKESLMGKLRNELVSYAGNSRTRIPFEIAKDPSVRYAVI